MSKPPPLGNVNAAYGCKLQIQAGHQWQTLCSIPYTPRCIGEAMHQLGRKRVWVLAWGSREYVSIDRYQNFIDHPLATGPLVNVRTAR